MRRRVAPIAIISSFMALAGAFLWNRRLTVLRLAPIKKHLRVKKHLYYLSDKHPKHRLDLFLPARKTNFPVIQFVHGGYWNSGDKDLYPKLTGLYSSIGRCFAARGIGVAIQNYRLVPEVGIEGQLSDVRDAFLWLTKNIKEYGGDPRKIFLMGHSAGALLAMMFCADTSTLTKGNRNKILPKGYISLSGMVDVENMPAVYDKKLYKKITIPTFGTDPENLKRHNPLNYLRRHLPATLLLVGSKDEDFIIENTKRGVEKLKELGNIPLFHIIAPNDHRDMVLRIGSKEDNVSDYVEDFVKLLST
jgi:acetyl esterase/lipase